MTFIKGFEQKIFYQFSTTDLAKITQIWKHKTSIQPGNKKIIPAQKFHPFSEEKSSTKLEELVE